MSTEIDPACVAGTLNWCNKKRVERGMGELERLPRGTRGDPLSCPCGRATGLHVGAENWGDPAKGPKRWEGKLPLAVQQFVLLFDNGKLPQYDSNA